MKLNLILLQRFQNVYVNINRILTAAGKLIEGNHYAAGHVRWQSFFFKIEGFKFFCVLKFDYF